MLLRMHLSVCVSIVRNGREEIDDASCSGTSTSVMDECHVKQMKSVLEIYTQYFMHGNYYRCQNLSSKCLL